MKRQAGLTLIEAMISLALSLIVTSAMVALMANSLGTSTRVIHMSQLTDEMRNAMSMMTRDVRRANYSANSIFCYGYSKCGYDTSTEAKYSALQLGDIDITLVDDNACLTFTLDRNFNGGVTYALDPAAGFRLRNDAESGVAWIEMYTGNEEPNCSAADGADGWIELTDPGTVNITEFTVDDAGSFTKEVPESKTVTFDSRQREIKIILEGQLVVEEDMVSAGTLADTIVSRRLEDTIYVRNDFILPTI